MCVILRDTAVRLWFEPLCAFSLETREPYAIFYPAGIASVPWISAIGLDERLR